MEGQRSDECGIKQIRTCTVIINVVGQGSDERGINQNYCYINLIGQGSDEHGIIQLCTYTIITRMKGRNQIEGDIN